MTSALAVWPFIPTTWAPPRPTCRHCGRNRVNRPRGLCWTCYYTPAISNLYPSTHKHAPKCHGSTRNVPPPRAPTEAPVGSAAKVEVLAGRADSRTSLWHDGDSRVRVRPLSDAKFLRRLRKLLDRCPAIADAIQGVCHP